MLGEASGISDDPVHPVIGLDNKGSTLLVTVDPVNLEEYPELPKEESALAEKEREDGVSVTPGRPTAHIRAQLAVEDQDQAETDDEERQRASDENWVADVIFITIYVTVKLCECLPRRIAFYQSTLSDESTPLGINGPPREGARRRREGIRRRRRGGGRERIRRRRRVARRERIRRRRSIANGSRRRIANGSSRRIANGSRRRITNRSCPRRERIRRRRARREGIRRRPREDRRRVGAKVEQVAAARAAARVEDRRAARGPLERRRRARRRRRRGDGACAATNR